MFSRDRFMSKFLPICEKFIKNTSEKNIKEFQNELQNLDSSNLDFFQSYVLLTLMKKLDELGESRSNSSQAVALVQTLEIVLEKIHIKEITALKTILMMILRLIYDFQKAELRNDASEELENSSLICIGLAIERSPAHVIEALYQKENASHLGKIAFACVQILSKEKYQKLKIAAISCLRTLFYVHELADCDDTVLRCQVANVLFVFLPKISQTLIKISTSDTKYSRDLILNAIKALTAILKLIFQDYEGNELDLIFSNRDFEALFKFCEQKSVETTAKTSFQLLTKKLSTEEQFLELQSRERNKKTLNDYSQKLNLSLKKISVLQTHPERNIRLEYALMCGTLIDKSYHYLSPCFLMFLESLIALSQDSDKDIQQVGLKRIDSLKSDEFWKSCFQELWKRFFMRLPRTIRKRHTDEQTADFQFLKGLLLAATENDLKVMLAHPNHINQLCMCLISALEIDSDYSLLTQEFSYAHFKDKGISAKRYRKYSNVNEKSVISLIEDVIRTLGRMSLADAMHHELTEMWNAEMCSNNEIIHILSILIISRPRSDSSIKILALFLDEILENKHWYLEIQPSQHKSDSVTTSDWLVDRTPGLYESAIEMRVTSLTDEKRNTEKENLEDDYILSVQDAIFNVVHVCEILHSIGDAAEYLGSQFETKIFSVLHKILQKSASGNTAIREAANYALHCIKNALGKISVMQLIMDFSDYLSYHINMGLKKKELVTGALELLSAVLDASSIESISHLEGILLIVIEKCSKTAYREYTTNHLKVFQVFLKKLTTWIEILPNIEECSEIDVNRNENVFNDNEILSYYDSWKGMINQTKCTKERDIFEPHEIENTDENIEDDYAQSGAEAKPDLPHHIELLLKILQEVIKFISSKEQIQRVLSLECLTIGFPLLKDYENELLPLAHQIWYPFVERFKDGDPIVMLRCLELLEVLALQAKDFLLHRTVKDILPHLNNFLRKSAKNSLNQRIIAITQEIKLQLKLIDELTNIIIFMDVQEKELDSMLDAVIPYLDERQPIKLRDGVRVLLMKLLRYNAGLVYLKLLPILKENEIFELINKV